MISSTQCNMPCPGNSVEHCGGTRVVSRYLRRQTIESNVLLTVYVNPNNPAAADMPPNPNLKADSPAPSYVSDPASSFV